LPNIVVDSLWGKYSGSYCNYNNDAANSEAYGRLYNWPAVADKRGICPVGWHVPSDQEWAVLIDHLGGANVAGDKLKESGTNHWQGPNSGATNESGFNALPGGFRENFGSYRDMGVNGVWWTTSIGEEIPYPYCYNLWDGSEVSKVISFDLNGHSVRCIKEDKSNVNTLINDGKVIFYPNPVKDKLFVTMGNFLNGKITIYDLQGHVVVSMQTDSNPIDISKISKGVYVVKISDSKRMIIDKLIKE
jgi:uncharacterized protein (TIGR02145 family)